MPLLVTGSSSYTGALPPPGSTFEQAGTTFDGTTGDLVLNAFSPTFSATIGITLTFNGDGTGTVFADAGALGSASGPFTVAGSGPGPADPNAIPVMPLSGLLLTGAALAFVARRRLLQLVERK